MKKFSVLGTAVLLLALLIQGTSPAYAATTCTFTTTGKMMKLNADCTTDTTILIPNGFTLDGQGHTITAVDPAGDHFRGAVVKNGGAIAHVKNLTVTASGLADVCDGGVDALSGILFLGASGSITRSKALDINQGPSGCGEGNGIEVSNFGDNPNVVKVKIANNIISAYQRAGISAAGDVSVIVEGNTITGLGPVDYIAQNGIQLDSGALGTVQENNVSGNVFTPQTFASSGILLFFAPGDGIRVVENRVDANDVGIRLHGASFAKVNENRVTGSTFSGIILDSPGESVQNNIVAENRLSGNDPGGFGAGISLFGAEVMNNVIRNNRAEGNGHGFFIGSGAANNTLLQNRAFDNSFIGIWVGADSNTIRRNRAFRNGDLDILDDGASNTYSDNSCGTSSGPPVDCPEASSLSSSSALEVQQSPTQAVPPPQSFE